ncbi:2-C-methyl-D-erythritol 4-phosphate cytidylyltransferase [Siphonobacter sp. SORGH_AS_0500]|uniref:2-C-methyl-D-erythritol 4-phosphate cytidylyltransferase n=1 Tax=Siphonobacter sp. SORGH_AS_0500 TaxID=1864824 RepID=UPI000CAA6C7A|nr:2-C-methyl-D-erythritol 4-phosphate cytidylyltransferase [Siphonobacter sp. SORGH_AS_0500]PKK37971.1 2-C-methyl-D-erythritol 4-phosphate cytidylyltransferase [Siphonobacter sp. SORGH_AS_0500]
MKRYVILVAGGSGSRMGVSLPKQFLSLAGKPILIHTLERFLEYSPDLQVILCLPADQFSYWEQLRKEYPLPFSQPIIETPGGATRFQSVRNGLQQVTTDGLVAVHDGVRPLVPVSVIARSFEVAAESGTAIAAVAAKDSIRLVTEDAGNSALDRSKLRLVQTPQTFQVSLLKKAFEQAESPLFTDDASVAEAAGYPIHLLEGSYENIKITTPEDMAFAEALLKGSSLA